FGNGELKPVTRTFYLWIAPATTQENYPRACRAAIHRLSLIYLVKEHSGCQNQIKAHRNAL
ncbi:MAG: hypothetical protein KDA20_13620, partial [Phycisphaerales bacterium]|nr:hypothetical protein [Phycisphaerales bacterium]